jgi:iron complex transport system ATP-binding protein
VVAKNDLDYPVARALASELVTVEAFQCAGKREMERCEALLRRCGTLLSCPERLGPMNEACRSLTETEGVRILTAAAFLSGKESL